MAKPLWHGVYPAATTQFAADLSLDIPACHRTLTALVADGVDGLVLLGTVGENNSLQPEEKRLALRAGIDAVGGRVPLVAGVSELTTDRAVEFARDAEKLGIGALMGLPAMVYVPTPAELYAHFRAVAEATALPIMLYNNPPAYRVSIGVETLGLREPARIAVHHVLAQQHDRTRRNRVPVRLERPERSAPDDPRGRIEPHGLGEDHPRVWQCAHIVGRRQPRA